MQQPEKNERKHQDNNNEIQGQNLKVMLVVAALVVLGIWLVTAFGKQIKLEECLEAGHRNCAQMNAEPSDK